MIRRAIADHVRTALKDTPVVLVHGARQTGKTTLVLEMAREMGASYLTMDDAVTLAAALQDPQGFVLNMPGPVVLDEVQKVPALFPAIKLAVDRNRRPGMFLLTGSANVLALPRLSESLAGRMEIVQLFPFSQSELEKSGENFVDWIFAGSPPKTGTWRDSGKSLQERVCAGGFPDAVKRNDFKRRSAWFESYISTIVQRDIRDLANVEGFTALPNLLVLLASRTANLLNIADIARVTGIPHTTASRYLSLLETLFLVTRLPPWYANVGKRLVKTPKIHLCDGALVCHLLNLSVERFRKEPLMFGGLLESFVFMELKKCVSWSDFPVRMYYFRTPGGAEVDVLLEDRRGRLAGVEIKSSATVRENDFKGLHVCAASTKDRFLRGIVLYAGNTAVPFGGNMWAVPIQALWNPGGT